MRRFELQELLARQGESGRAWQEFLRTSSLSMGIYHLKRGQADLQQPHTQDEVYYVLSGQARFTCAGADQPVSPGTILYVERAVEHRFHDISEDLTVLVFFAPPEGSLAAASSPPASAG